MAIGARRAGSIFGCAHGQRRHVLCDRRYSHRRVVVALPRRVSCKPAQLPLSFGEHHDFCCPYTLYRGGPPMQPLRGENPAGTSIRTEAERLLAAYRNLDLTRQPPRNGPDACRNTGSVREDRLLERITRTYQHVFADADALIEDAIEEARKLTQSSRGELQRVRAKIRQLDKTLASMTGLLVDPDAAGEAQRYIEAAPTRAVSRQIGGTRSTAGAPSAGDGRGPPKTVHVVRSTWRAGAASADRGRAGRRRPRPHRPTGRRRPASPRGSSGIAGDGRHADGDA